MAKVQQTGQLILTTPGESQEELSVSMADEPGYGPTDALFAEIAFIYAESHRGEATAVE